MPASSSSRTAWRPSTCSPPRAPGLPARPPDGARRPGRLARGRRRGRRPSLRGSRVDQGDGPCRPPPLLGRARRRPRRACPSPSPARRRRRASRACISSRTGRQLRGVEHDGAVDVLRLPARGPHRPRPPRRAGRSLSAPRQPLVGVGEVRADVAEAGGAEQGVGAGVGDDVGVAVARRARRRRRSATPPSTSGAVGSSDHGWTSKPLPTRITRTRARLRAPRGRAGAVIFAVRRLAVHDEHPATGRLDQRGIVGAVGAAGVGARAARRPGTPAASARRRTGVRSTVAAADLAQRVDHRTAGTDGVGAGSRRAAIDALATGRRRRAGGRRRAPATTSASSGTAASPARTDVAAGGAAGDHGVGAGLGIAGAVGRHDEHDAVARVAGGAERPVEDPARRRGARTAWARRSASPEPAATTIAQTVRRQLRPAPRRGGARPLPRRR